MLGCGGASQTSNGSDSDSQTGSSGDTSDSEDTTAGPNARPNWHEDMAPLVAANCQSCHTSGGIGPFSLETYAEASAWAPVMADEVEGQTMPPWHALETPVCQPSHTFKYDARLAPEQIAMFREWADLGAPEGDPELAAPIPAPPSLDLDNPTTTVQMQSSVSVDKVGKSLDFFHCISLDPGHTEDVYLTGIQTLPGNREIVHHVLTYIDETAASASWPGGVKQNCGGGSGVNAPTQLIGGWIPGGLPMQPPQGVGIVLPAGARLILNVHYHASGAGPEQDDGTGLALRWTTEKPDYTSFFMLLGAPGQGSSLTGPLQIPAGASGHVEEYEWVVSAGGQPFPDTVDARFWAVANHMHKVGVDMRVWVEDRDTSEESCLLHTPEWDFNWQRIYELDAPIDQGFRVRAGDRVRIRCEYNNTLENQSLVEALDEVGESEPIDVGQGEGTLDEMCLTAVGVAVRGL